MFNLDKFIAECVTKRPVSMFNADIEANKETLNREIKGKKICVIGGAGSIGSSFIKAILRFEPKSVIVIDLNENGLAELVRDIRSTYGLFVPKEFRCYTLNFADPIFMRIFREEKGFDIVANFSAHKHVRSEKDRYSVQALIENNDIKAKKLMDLLCEFPPKHFFCVSTDKAANPVNIMGASKRIMEDLVMAYNDKFKVTTARFANVAFSNGSLPDGWIHRMQKKQPLAAPSDVKRYFVSPEEWLYLFNNANSVFTDSFHGMCFSIMFYKKLFVCDRRGNGTFGNMSSRTKDLIDLFDIKISTYEELCFADLSGSEKQINDIIDAQNKNSKKFIEVALGF